MILDLFWIIIVVELKWLFVKMVFTCCEENCKKSFSTKSNWNKHERLKNHRPQTDDKNESPFFDVFHCQTNGCVTKSEYKHNFAKQLKTCTDLKMKEPLLLTKYVPFFPNFLLRDQIATDMSTFSTATIWQTILHLMSLIINMMNRSRTKPCRQLLLLLKRSPPKFPKVSPTKFPPTTQKRKMPHLTKIKSLNHWV